MGALRDLTGLKFGNLTVIRRDGSNKHKKATWWCKCDCDGNEKSYISIHLLNGNTKSCGCLQRIAASESNKKYNTYDLSGEHGIGWTSNTNREFYFDLEDYDKIKNYSWHKHKDGYLRTRVGVKEDGKNIYALQHRLLLNCLDNINEVDHKNRIPHDNRKENLIIVTHNENMKNYGKYKSNKSGVIGVYYCSRENAWKSQIQFNNKKIHLGTFSNIKDAIMVRLKKEKELYNSINKKPPQIDLIQKYGI